MRQFGAKGKPERRTRESIPPLRDSLNGFKPDPDETTSYEVILLRVKRKIENGDFASAKKNLGKILESDPKNRYAITMLARLYFKIGDIEKAEETFNENKASNNIFLYNTMLVGYGKAEEDEKAEEVFREVVGKGIADVYSYNSMIDMHGHRFELEEVRELFNEAVELGIANPYTYNRMIYTCARVVEIVEKMHKKEIVEEARLAFDRAVEEGLANEHTYTSMLGVYSNVGKSRLGMELLRKAIEKGFDTPIAYKKVFYAYVRVKDNKGAESVYLLAKKNGKGAEELKKRLDRFMSYQEK